MKLRRKFFIFFIVFVLGSGLVSAQKASRQSAADAFSSGNYALAYKQYSELLATYPRDPAYKYFSAACLVKMEKDPVEAENLIEQALNSGSLKSLPDDAVFYLARTQHLQGKYEQAEKTYTRYTAEAGRKRAKELDVPRYIEQCRQSTGRLIETSPIVASEIPPDMTIKTVTRQMLPPEKDSLLATRLEKQYKADSTEAASNKMKQSQVVTVVVTVDTASTISSKDNVSNAFVKKDTIVNYPAVALDPVKDEVTEVIDTTIRIREILAKPVGVLSVFEILPQPVTDPKAEIEVNAQPPEGLVYRIQTAVFRNPVQLSYFKGISPIYGIKAAGSSVTTYYAGIFRKMADASKALASVRGKGFKDSFVVAHLGNKPVSSERAAILEKEWGSKPLYASENSDSQKIDTMPPTLLLKVEILRSIQPLKEDAIAPMIRMAGKRNFDMAKMDNGSVAYLIGNFITFESAEEFAGLLRRNGYNDAKVVAWLGSREIDIQTAKQLFETLK